MPVVPVVEAVKNEEPKAAASPPVAANGVRHASPVSFAISRISLVGVNY